MSAPIQRSFAGGEIAPSLHGRADQVKYATGLKTCRNFQIDSSGAASNRQGTQFIAEAGGALNSSRFLKFVFNDDQAYVIEAVQGFMRFYRNGARINHIVFPAWSGAANYVLGDCVLSGGLMYYCILAHINHVPPNATYWYLEPSPDFFYAVPSPYVTADLGSLKYDQSGDVLTITNQGYPPMELKRFGERFWTLTAVSTSPSIAAPAGLAAAPGAAGALPYSYVVTAVKAETYEESLASASDPAIGAAPTSALPNTLAWTAVAGAVEYNVYCDREGNGVYGFIGVAATNAFNDTGFIPDLSNTPPIARVLFASASNYPKTSSYYQQRHIFADTINAPQTAWASRSGMFKNFSISSPIQDDDAITFGVFGKKVNRIEHLIEVGRLIVLTSGGVFTIQGDVNGVLVPTAINPKQQGYLGASSVAPITVDNSVVFVQARNSSLRDLAYDYRVDGYIGNDLTVFASHLIKGFTITRMDYAEIPDSIIWCIRNDGALLGLTYIKEQQMVAWHRHDTNGVFEDVCVVPEGGHDAVYLLVRRPFGTAGGYMRTVERMPARLIVDQVFDSKFLDSWSIYDGTNADLTNRMYLTTVSGGWTVSAALRLTSDLAFFSAGDVGNVVEIRTGATKLRLKITGYTSTTVVLVTAEKTVPVSMRSTFSTTDWTRCVDVVTLPVEAFSALGPLLEGVTVGIYADGFVLPQQTVVGGVVTLPRCYGVIVVGLPYVSEMELLDIDNPQSDVRGKQKHVTSAQLLVEKTRGLKVGTDPDALTEYAPDEPAALGDVPALVTATIDLSVEAQWEPGGRVIIRQDDPLPATVLAVITNVDIGG